MLCSDTTPTDPTEAARERVCRLTRREREIADLMARGYSNAAVCRLLWISPKTVETHVGSILAKLAGSADAAHHHRRVVAVVAYLSATRTTH